MLMSKRAIKASFKTRKNFQEILPLTLNKRTNFKLTKTLIHLLRKTNDSLYNLMTGDKTSGKGKLQER